MRLHSASPSPLPSEACDVSPWKNFSNSRRRVSASMPQPSSDTQHTTSSRAPSRPSSPARPP